ncbi:esterase-like activity of phytase family protein [Nocardia sp. NPDC127526]|uniref:esterase-like activity of phytase family protein n=1 Tax=Nocardia sp. NPDC127526 TaxID=3345393 RepID=UPI00363BFE12
MRPPPPVPSTVSILAADSTTASKLLVMERSFVAGVGNKVRVYEADLRSATNVHGASTAGARPVTKRLLVDLDDVGLSHIDNAEQVTQVVALAVR